MKVLCINNNGWYDFNGNNYCFLCKRMEVLNHPKLGEEYNVSNISLDEHGDMIYQIDKFPNGKWDAEGFVITSIEAPCYKLKVPEPNQ